MKLENDITHKLIIEKAREQLLADGKFWKDEVLQDTPFVPWAAFVQWPFVRRTLERELGEELMPIAHGDDKFDPNIDPERFLPAGRRKGQGYSRPSAQPARVAMAWAERRHASAAAAWRGFERLLQTYQKQGLPVTYTPTALPALSFNPAPAE